MNRTDLRNSMKRHNISGEISGRGASLQVAFAVDGEADRFMALIANWDGYTTQSGVTVLKANHDADSASRRNVD